MSSLRFEEFQDEGKEKLKEIYGPLVRVYPGGVVMNEKYKYFADKIINMEVRKDDVWVVSLPKTGSTWLQEMVWCVENDVDLEKAKVDQTTRAVLLELTTFMNDIEAKWFTKTFGEPVDKVINDTSRRFIKSHLPLQLLPRQLLQVKPKILYITRNPKDMFVSSYFFYSMLSPNVEFTLDEFCEFMLKDELPFFPYWEHVLSFWELKDEPNMLFLTYEELKRDVVGVLDRVTNFLGKNLTVGEKEKLLDHLSFEKMKSNKAVSYDSMFKLRFGSDFKQQGEKAFLRKGQVGDWKNHISAEMTVRLDKWTKQNMKGTQLEF